MAEYKGYFIFGKALKVYPGSAYWCSPQGDIFTNDLGGSILIARLGGAVFESEQAAEDHGLELCREWINQKQANENYRLSRLHR
jgi:hypothetical protein